MASSPARAVGDQAPVALPADLPAHLTASLVADLDDGDAAAMSSLAAALAAVPDSRGRRGRRHELTGVLTIGACACLTGATSYVAISEWATARGAAVLDCLGAQHSTGAARAPGGGPPPAAAARPRGRPRLRGCVQTPAAGGGAGGAGAQLPAQKARAARGQRREP